MNPRLIAATGMVLLVAVTGAFITTDWCRTDTGLMWFIGVVLALGGGILAATT
jgi:hypothetical protein